MVSGSHFLNSEGLLPRPDSLISRFTDHIINHSSDFRTLFTYLPQIHNNTCHFSQ